MFWGLIMEPNKRYTQTLESSFHVSMASLDLTTTDERMVQVMLGYEDRNYLICSLSKSSNWQVPLDLNFKEGTKIAFTCNGQGNVHLTGYLIPDEDLDLDELEEEEEEEDTDTDPAVVNVGKNLEGKRKAADTLKGEKKVKRPKKAVKAESSDEDNLELDGIDEDDSEDSDDENNVNNEDESEEDDDEEEEEEDDEEDEDEVIVKEKPQKQQKENKSKQAQQQQKKEDKKKLVNGKETKQEQQTKQQAKQQKKNKAEQQQQTSPSEQKKRVVEGGVQVEDMKAGNGAPAKPGKFISVYYVGRLKNGKKFDATTQGEGFKFRLGKGEVIKGWDVGISGMKVGGKRRITIPPAMAYGAKGSPPVIPGNSTLVFEVELRNVH